MSSVTAPIKVSHDTDEVVSHAAHFLHMSKKQIVEDAVREYVERHRDEINQGVRAALMHLDGSAQADVSLLTGFSAEEIESLGGID